MLQADVERFETAARAPDVDQEKKRPASYFLWISGPDIATDVAGRVQYRASAA